MGRNERLYEDGINWLTSHNGQFDSEIVKIQINFYIKALKGCNGFAYAKNFFETVLISAAYSNLERDDMPNFINNILKREDIENAINTGTLDKWMRENSN